MTNGRNPAFESFAWLPLVEVQAHPARVSARMHSGREMRGKLAIYAGASSNRILSMTGTSSALGAASF